MTDGVFEVQVDRLPERRVERARLVFNPMTTGGAHVVAGVDDADGAMVRFGGLPVMALPRVSGLSADGGTILFTTSQEYDTPLMPLLLLDLASGQEQRFELHAHVPRDSPVALSPDGRRVAVLSTAGGDGDQPAKVFVDLLDAASGDVARLWTASGESWSSGEGSLSWSPDARMLAVTYLWFDHEESHDDWERTVILDATTGAELHRLDYVGEIGWLSPHEVLIWNICEAEDGVFDTRSGVLRELGIAWLPSQSSGGLVAALSGRIVCSRGFNDAPSAYFHTDAAGQDIRPLFTTTDTITALFLAPLTDPLSTAGPATSNLTAGALSAAGHPPPVSVRWLTRDRYVPARFSGRTGSPGERPRSHGSGTPPTVSCRRRPLTRPASGVDARRVGDLGCGSEQREAKDRCGGAVERVIRGRRTGTASPLSGGTARPTANSLEDE